MVALGDGDDETKSLEGDSAGDEEEEEEVKAVEGNTVGDLSGTEAQDFDSQCSPCTLPGEKFICDNVDDPQFLQNTVPFDDTVEFEDAFEAQPVNVCGETQVLDDPAYIDNLDTQLFVECHNGRSEETDDRTEVLDNSDELSVDNSMKKVGKCQRHLESMLYSTPCKQGDQECNGNCIGENFTGEDVDELQFLCSTVPCSETGPFEDVFDTQVVDLVGETQVLDGSNCLENVSTQILIECDVDGDGDKGTPIAEVLGNKEFSGNDIVKKVGNEEHMLYTVPGKQGEEGSKAESDGLLKEQHSSELYFCTATPLEKPPEPKDGSFRRGFTSVRAAALRASGLAARRKASEQTKSASCSISNGSQLLKEHTAEDDGVPFMRNLSPFGEEVNWEYFMGDHSEQMKEKRNEKKCRVGSSAVRKLFTDDTPTEIKGSADHINNVNGVDMPQLTCGNGLAGLSYVDSQEPGELSQANALDFVEKFLECCDQELDKGVGLGKSTVEKPKHALGAKGTQSLAKRANLTSTIREKEIFNWDDTREDEGGGVFFCKMKEAFFDNGDQRKRSFTKTGKLRYPDSKGSKTAKESRYREEPQGIHEKFGGLVHSDSRLVLHNKNGNEITAQVAGKKFKKNLAGELDEQLNIGSSDGMKATVPDKEVPDMLNVGFDTQIAAEAMEALCCGLDMADHDCSDLNQGSKGMFDGSPKSETKNKEGSKKNFPQKRGSPDSIIITRQSKRRKRVNTKFSKEFSVSSCRQAKNVKKHSDREPANAKLTGPKCNAEQCLDTIPNECLDNTPSKVVSDGKRGKSLKTNDIDKAGKCSTALSHGHIPVKKLPVQEQPGYFTPVACRTRQCKLAIQSARAENTSRSLRQSIDAPTEVSAPKSKRKMTSNALDSPDVLNTKEGLPRSGSSQFGELEIDKPELWEPKSTDKPASLEIDLLSYPRGRRACRKSSNELNRNGSLNRLSRQFIGQESNVQSIARSKRLKIDATGTCMDQCMKKKTQTSLCTDPALFSLDAQSEQRSSQQIIHKGGSGDAAHDCNSSDINGNAIQKDVAGTHPSKRFDGSSTANGMSSEKVGVIEILEVSPQDRCKLSCSACNTPVNCRTPINVISPICMGDEYLKQSCRKNLSRSSLTKEINSLLADGPGPTSMAQDSRKRRDMANVRALFSHHLDDDIIKHQKKILARLGASIASSISDATHFITDNFVRTRNMLEAIAFGKPVVTHLWLESCGQASCFIDEKNYILRDAKKEKEFGFSLPVSLARACHHPLLQGLRILITPNTKPGKELLMRLVKAVHGLAVERVGRSVLKDGKIPDDLLVVSCEEDFAICVPFLEKGAAVYSSELLLNGIVTQKLEYERHRLFADHVKSTRSTIWLKKGSNQFVPVTKRK